MTDKPLPRTLIEAVEFFADETTCNQMLLEIKWPGGKVVCPKCGNESCHELSTRPGQLKCNKAECQKQFSLKKDTIFEKSPLSLSLWFVAVWHIANCRNGISSYEVSRALGVTQPTAWFMLHRIREAMRCDSFSGGPKLAGEVESDETFVGGKAKNMHAKKREQLTGRGGVDKAAVQAIVERGGNAMTFVPDRLDRENLRGNILRSVSRDSALYTDSSSPSNGLGWAFDHQTVNHSIGEYVRGRVSTNLVECFFALLKRALKGTYIAVAPYHLARYAAEQGFRFNVRGLSGAARFLRLLQGVVGKRLTYRRLCAVGDSGFMGLK